MRGVRGALVALLALGSLACTAGPAAAQYFGQNKIQYRNYDWHSRRSDHFEVYYYTGLDSLGMRVLDLAEKTNLLLSKRMGHQLGRRVPIILYGSHNNFAQTNVTSELIDPSTGGFTEVLRNRVVLPFSGSYEDLRHVVVHELTHAYMFDMLYGGSAASMLARQTFYTIPLWFAEGLAEYMSLGMESNAEQFLRDGVIEGRLPPLMYSGGYIVYKQGQSALNYFVDHYGEDRLRDVLRRIKQMHGFDNAFERSAGISVAKFDEQWRAWLKRRYWPTVAVKQNAEHYARQLTDHRKDESYMNSSPSVSPQGDRVAYFSDRHQYTDVYLMSAIDGRVVRRVIRGERGVKFESIPLLRSSIGWSPDGGRLALVAKSGGGDVVYIVSVRDGRVLKRFNIGCDALAYAAWSPVSDSLVVTGLKDGRSDLWLINVASGAVTRLTDDTWDEKEPVWSPDGRRITFASDRSAPVVLEPARTQEGYGRYGIFELDLASDTVAKVLDTAGEDHSPAWSPSGEELAFVSNRNGTPNLYLYEQSTQLVTQLTDVVGGISSVSWSRQNDRVVFSAYNHSGIDVFGVKVALSVHDAVARIRRQTPAAAMTLAEAERPEVDSVRVAPVRGALAGAWPDTMSMPRDTVAAGPPMAQLRDRGAHRDTLGEVMPAVSEPPVADPPVGEPPAWTGGGFHEPYAPAPDTLRPLPSTVPLVDRGGPFALPDSILGQTPTQYRPHLSLDFAGSSLVAASGYGFAGTAQFQFSDFLGDHSLYLATDLFGGSLEETNALMIYNYLPRRWDFSAGAFHFNNYYSGRVTALGEQLSSPQLFSERNFGALVGASYPFDRFRRIEVNLTQTFLERKFYAQNAFGDYFITGREYRSVTAPTVSLISDNSLWGYYGPVNGHRSNLTYSPALGWFDNALTYHTFLADLRSYWDLTHSYSLAVRGLGAFSTGRDPQVFRVGGFSTLRGYADYSLLGSHVAMLNTEFRFPFIQQFGIVGLPLGLLNMRGVAFCDAGLIGQEGRPFRFVPVSSAILPQNGYAFGFGTGVRSAAAFMLFKLDVAWSSDFVLASRPHWYFSIGPEF
jgi:Tol biopolymer transport system component